MENSEFIYAFMAVWIGTLAGIFGITKYYEWQERKNGTDSGNSAGRKGNSEDPSV